MADAKSMNVSLGGHFKLSEAQTLMTEDEKAHVGGVICISDGQPDVCYGLHETRHCSSSESYQQIHEQPREGALESCEWILRYLKGSSDMTLCYGGTNIQLLGFVDSDFAGDVDSQRSTNGYVFTLGSRVVR